MKRILILALIILNIANASAQNYWSKVPLPNPGNYGVGGQIIRADDNGKIYFGDDNESKLYSFDGSSFNYMYDLSFDDFIFDRFGDAWAVQGNEIFHYDSTGNPIGYFFDSKVLVGSVICKDKYGEFWIASESRYALNTLDIYKFNPQTASTVIADSISLSGIFNGFSLLTIRADSAGSIWVEPYYNGLVKYDQSGFTIYHLDSLFPGTTGILDFSVKQNNDLYVITNDYLAACTDTLRKFDGTNWSTVSLPSGSCTTLDELHFDKNGDMWISSDSAIYKFNGINLNTSSIPSAIFSGSLPNANINLIEHNNQVNCISISAGGTDWSLLSFNPNGINKITGKVYIDQNSDGQYQQSEKIYNASIVNCSGNYVLNNITGFQYFLPNPTSTSVGITAPKYWHVNGPNPVNVLQTSAAQVTDNINFGLIPSSTVDDIQVDAMSDIIRPGMSSSFWLEINNIGTLTMSDSVTVLLDSNIHYLPYPNPSLTISGQLLSWKYGTLQPFENKYVMINVYADTIVSIGDTIRNLITAYPFLNDADTINNTYLTDWEVVSSYDPNNKQVIPEGVGPTHNILNQELTYNIRFQNTGNDTAFTIIVFDTLSNDLDLSTFRLIGSGSPCEISLIDRAFTFRFNNILLPDSNINEPGSHSFVSFKIKPKSTVVPGTLIQNNAAIVFDYNAPVITNTAFSTIQLFVSLQEKDIPDAELIVLPNPSHQLENIHLNRYFENKSSYSISDITGKLIQKGDFSGDILPSSAFGLERGIYILKINTSKNKVYSSRIIIE